MLRAIAPFIVKPGKTLVAIALALSCPFAFSQDAKQALTGSAERARTILKQGIENKDPDVRIQAVIAGSMIGKNERVVTVLEQCVSDKDVPVRIAAINVLADLKSPTSKAVLEKSLSTDEVPEVRFAAAKALYALQDPAGKQALVDVYQGATKTSSNMFTTKMRNVKRQFHSVQSGAMFMLSQGIGYVPLPGVGEGFSATMELLNDPDLSPRATAFLLLARKDDAQSNEFVKKALKDDDWSVRAAAVQVIAQGARNPLRESLVPLFDDKKEKVRFRAAGAYLHLYLKNASPQGK